MAKKASVKQQKSKLEVASVILMAFAGVLFLGRVFAGTGNFGLTSDVSQLQKNDSVEVFVRISPQSEIDGVDAVVTYDPQKLEFASINDANSAFPLKLKHDQVPGKIEIIRGILGDKVSEVDSLVAAVTFNAIAKSGRTTLTVQGNATRDGAYTDPQSSELRLRFQNSSKSGGGKGGGDKVPPGRSKKNQ